MTHAMKANRILYDNGIHSKVEKINDDPDIHNISRGISIRLDSDGIFTIDGVTPILESYGDELVTANWVRQLLASKGIN